MTNNIHLKNRTLTILILGFLSAIGPFSIDMYLPGFPAMAIDLKVSVDVISYSLASFFVGVCIGQLLCGPLLDRYGRKLPLIVGLGLYIVASVGCVLSNSIETLIVFRFFQALGGCVGMVAPRAIIRDVFPVEENAKIFSLMILILGVAPICAPTAGSFLISMYGWHSVFVALTGIGIIVLLLVIFKLPESKQPDPNYSLKAKPILSSFYAVLKVPQFYTYSLMGAISAAGLFAYLAGSPFVFMKLYGTTEQQYGYIFAIIAAGLILCSQLNNQLLKKYSSQQITLVTLSLQTLVGIALFAGTLFHWLNLYSTITLIALFLSCQGFAFPNSSALSMAPFTKNAGTASALMGAMQMAFGALAAAIIGLSNPTSALPLAVIMAACALIALLILLLGTFKIKYQSRKTDVEESALDMMEKV
ncbi:MAG: Bcr/CflA family efflux MFS transporter [Chitinophagaceae bacterium]|nr:MAG: Bcr/CflA family efflux MFS transporter [Chitinophagaceae bacterium]